MKSNQPSARNESAAQTEQKEEATVPATTRRKVESYDIAKSDETLQLATDVARFIRENKLFLNMQGKEYVNVEGWQYAGSRLGILPIVEELTNLSDGQEVKYQSRVRLLNLRNEQIVGSGFAICSNKEPGKKFFQEFAIASMAQTRAIGKAYRNILAWLIRAAGYEPTPAEEMEYGQNPTGNQEAQDRRNGSDSAPAPRVKAETPAPAIAAVPVAEEPAAPTVPMATTRQKAEILLLLNNDVVTKDEKEKMIASINKLDRERADKAIEKLKKIIAQRQSGQPPVQQVA
ncbi:MAG TPA: hypothetical protein VF646_12595 [Cytophagales bacterium]